MKSILTKYWREIVLAVAVFITIAPLMKSGYFPHHDDLQIIRLLEIRKCFADLQIPCRWVPDMGFGFGYPLYNFYSVFPYYLGGLISYFTSFINTAKILFMLTQVFAGLGMYLLVKQLFNKNAGLVSSVLYLYAPYKAVDIYVRGALSESFALALAPFVFYFLFKLAKKDSLKDFSGLTISFALFLLTHNISTLLFVPVFALVLIYLFLTSKKSLKQILPALALGVGISAFFTLPAYFEKGLVQTESLTRFELNFRSHFVNISQFISTKWGYGPSVLGEKDSLSFQVGLIHLVLFTSGLLFLIFYILKIKLPFLDYGKQNKNRVIVLASAVVLFLLSLFMAHYRSAFVWESFNLLSYVQFPWRFLGLVSFFASIAGGGIVYFVVKKRQESIALTLTAFIIAFNFIYFRPSHMYQITDAQKFSNAHWRAQIKGSILDYLPKTALEPLEPASSVPWPAEGEAIITGFTKNTDSFSFNAQIEKSAKIIVPVFYFPEWKVKMFEGFISPEYDRFGRIVVNLPAGNYSIEGQLFNTPIRSIGNAISGVSFILLGGILIYAKNKKHKN